MSTLQRALRTEDQLVYLHIPKTAGTTLISVLDQHFAPHEICPATFDLDLPAIARELDGYRLIRGHFHYGTLSRLLSPRAVYITFLRDPVERAISQYAHLQNHTPDPPHAYGPGMDLEEYCYHPIASAQITNLQTRWLASTFDFATPAEFRESWANDREEIRAGKWPSAREAAAVLDSLVFFGLAERFAESLALLADTFGWKPISRVEALNIAPKRPGRDQIPLHVLDRLLQLNQEDLHLYEHARQVFDARYTQLLREQAAHAVAVSLPAAGERMTALHYTLDQPLRSDSVWYRVEHDEKGRVWRWTGPEARTRLDFALADDQDLLLRFGVVHAVSMEVLQSLQVAVNDQPIVLSRSAGEHGAIIFEGKIPRAALQRADAYSTIEFQVERTIAPHALDAANPDTRKLGVALGWLDLRPAGRA